MKQQAYTALYEADDEGGYVVSVPSLPGCYSQGNTLEEAEKHITEAVEVYIESLREQHLDLPVERMWQGRIQVAV